MALACTNHPDVVTDLKECSRCGQTFCNDCVISLGGKPICSACKQQNLLDIRSGAEGGLDLAGRGARFGAQMIDGVVFFFSIMVIILLFTFVLLALGKNSAAAVVGTIIYFASIFLFPTLYEGFMLARFGQTLGKMAVGIQVVHSDGQKLTTAGAWKRCGSRILMAFVPLLGLIDILYIFGERRTCLHDRAASTAVVNKPR